MSYLNARVHLKVRGLVQGVFFRANAESTARLLGLKGWVRNTSEGGVEIVAEGDKKVLENFVAWCKKGPPRARVERIEVEWLDYVGEFADFRTVA